MQWLIDRVRSLSSIPRTLAENQTLLTLSLMQILVMLGFGMVAPVLPLYALTFNVSAALVGLLVTAFGLARMLSNLPAGRLADRFGRRPLILAGPIVTAVGALLAAVAPNFWVLVFARFIQGGGSAIYATAAMVMLMDISLPETRGKIMSIFQGSLLLGVSFGPAVGGLTASLVGLAGVFYLYAATSVIVFVWGWMRVYETLGSDEPVSAGGPDDEPEPPEPVSTRSLLMDINFIAIAIVGFSIFFTRTGTRQTMVPLIGEEELGLTAFAIGNVLTVGSVFNALALPFAGWSIDRLGRKRTIVPSIVLSGLGVLFFAFAPDLITFVIASALLGIAIGISGPAPAAYVADLSAGRSYGTTLGMFRTVGDFGFVVGPVLLGWISDMWGYGFSLYVNAGLLFIAAVVFQFIAREFHVPPEQQASEPATAGAAGPSSDD